MFLKKDKINRYVDFKFIFAPKQIHNNGLWTYSPPSVCPIYSILFCPNEQNRKYCMFDYEPHTTLAVPTLLNRDRKVIYRERLVFRFTEMSVS